MYPEFLDQAAVLAVRISRNHPLLDGNKRLAWGCLTMFCVLNGHELDVPTEQAVSTCWRWQLATWTKQRCPSGSPCGLTGNADGQRSADRSRISMRAGRLRNCSRSAATCSENSSRRPAASAARRAFLSNIADRV